MKITIKKLQGGEYNIEVEPDTKVFEIKKNIALKSGIPIHLQKLLYMGRALVDENTIASYPGIKNGSKLNLVEKKPEGFVEGFTKYYKETGMSDEEAKNTAERLLRIVDEKFNSMSWDDIDRLCGDLILEESGETRPPAETEMDCDDTFGL